MEYAGTGKKYLPENAQPGPAIQVSVDLDAVAQWKSNWSILNEALKKENDISRSKDINAQTEDVDLTVPEAMTTTLNMNGYKLNRNLTVATENTGRAMTISGDLTLKKATVTGAMNSGNGGGVMVEDNGKFTVEDVVIENNSTTNGRGAGIYVNKDSTVNISGLITIQDNKRIVNKDEKTGETKDPIESTENVYLVKEAKLTVTDKLSEETKIGISMEEPGVFTSGLKDKGEATNFTSDDPDYTVGINKDGEAYLIKKPKFKTCSLLLAGNIGVNFFLELADNSGMD